MAQESPRNETPWRNETLDRFLRYCRTEKNFSDQTVKAYRTDLDRLGEYCWTIGREVELDAIEDRELDQYVAWLRQKELADSTIERHVSSIRSYYAFLVKRDLREDNPAGDLSFTSKGRRLPTVWSESEVEEFLNVIEDSEGIRDEALFELLYSTGIRVSELTNLDWDDYSPSERTIRVLGKGKTERIAPVGPQAARKLAEYRTTVPDEPESPIFVNQRNGDRLTARGVRYLVDKYHKQVSVTKPLSPHVFRHSCATHMLNRGANLKTVQALLGHQTLSTTQIYTHVSTDQLKSVYDQTHPRAFSDET